MNWIAVYTCLRIKSSSYHRIFSKNSNLQKEIWSCLASCSALHLGKIMFDLNCLINNNLRWLLTLYHLWNNTNSPWMLKTVWRVNMFCTEQSVSIAFEYNRKTWLPSSLLKRELGAKRQLRWVCSSARWLISHSFWKENHCSTC